MNMSNENTVGSDAKKVCPYCAEEILATARKCRYCGEWLEESQDQYEPVAEEISGGASEEDDESEQGVSFWKVLGWIGSVLLLLIYVLGKLRIWKWWDKVF